MEARRTPAGVRVGGDARQRLHDARGYGYPADGGEILLTTVEAAHLLYRGDLTSVDGLDFAAFVNAAAETDFGVQFPIFDDLRKRGFYLDPIDRPDVPVQPAGASYVVYERGAGRDPSAIAFAVRTVGEHTSIALGELAPVVIAVVDAEGEAGYIEIDRIDLTGSLPVPDMTGISGTIVGDRVYLWDPPERLYREWFFGRPIGGREVTADPLVISLVEAAYLSERGSIDVSLERICDRGRALNGAAFDRQVRVYRALREAGVVPKTGYKFGADFRTYSSFAGLDEMGHSEHLVRVCAPDDIVDPVRLSLDVRLAHGVGKRMVFAITRGNPDTALTWLSVARLTP